MKKIKFKRSILLIILLLNLYNLSSQINSSSPQVVIRRDDHVATVEMDYNAFGGWGSNLWSIGNTGTEVCGYRLRWWPDPLSISQIDFSLGCKHNSSSGTTIIATENSPHEMVSSNKMVQIQPLANNVLYHLKVEKLNGFGQVCSPPTTLQFLGGDSTRVGQLRSTMTFFDDFNLPMGPNDERKWNNASTPQTDPRFNLFFINSQCHTHSLNGTLNDAAGDLTCPF